MNTIHTQKKCPSYPVSIFMAGSVEDAKKYCQLYCDYNPLCVTVSATSYIYTGGNEDGFVVGLINYPRFPNTPENIKARAIDLGEALLRQLGQQSFSIQTPSETIFFSSRPQDREGFL